MALGRGGGSHVIAAVSPEREVVADLARRAAMVAPLAVALGVVGWGLAGGVSVAFGLAVVVSNLLVAAALQTWAADRSLELVPLATLGGFGIRTSVVCAAVLAVGDAAWVAIVPLGVTLVIAHLGLLAWECRHVSATLAFPGLKPALGQE